MYLTQILLPLYDNHGHKLPKDKYDAVCNQLIDRFNGLTAYTRTPAKGFWQEDGQRTIHDDIIIYEVMSDQSETNWWKEYRDKLEKIFSQETVIIRQHEVKVL